MSKITCVGCGMMGSNIVDSFMKNGHEVIIVDVNKKNAESFIKRGAHYFENLSDSDNSKFILLSLPNGNIVKSVLKSCSDEFLKNKIIVNTTSEVPSEAIETELFLISKQAKYIDTTILTYQGEVGTKYSYLLYSGNQEAFNYIEEDLKSLSSNPIYLGEDSIVGAEIIDLVAISCHFGFSYTPFEAFSYCKQYDVSIDEYLINLKKTLNYLSIQSKKNKKKKHLDNNLSEIYKLLIKENINERLSDSWLTESNRSVANHYRKMLKIMNSKFEY